ncbi:hypothetical protein CTI12_AA149190 [Artemisia annua]|uniref:Uncharacterized protein n=1 Tax=Artemisia annua TaxID=35608 RepID=A0A2U1PI53_ARTAN|nr:hypothetical protein CTI12_AA149190 [Artemisia annua]
MRMDEGTSAMCINPWGRNSYARCLIKLSAVHDLLEFVQVDIPLPNGKGHYTEYIDIDSVGDPSASGSLWEQCNASTSNNKSSVSVLEDSDDEVDEVLEMEGGGFLNDMEDYYDGYDDQVVLPDKLQAICDQFDIRLNTRRR